jgi:hypothetical protein
MQDLWAIGDAMPADQIVTRCTNVSYQFLLDQKATFDM